MEKLTSEEIVGRLSDLDVLDILREVVELESILYQKAKSEGHEIVWDEDSTYFLYFGEMIEEMGAEKVMVLLRSYSDERRREVLKKVLEFNVLMASLQVKEPGKEIWCASLNMSEVLGAGGGGGDIIFRCDITMKNFTEGSFLCIQWKKNRNIFPNWKNLRAKAMNSFWS